MKILLDPNKKYFKANLHCHSTYSDGKASVETLKEEYKKRGYSIVAFTDHEFVVDNSRLDDDEFLTITSCEVAIKEFSNQSTLKNLHMRVCHLNFYALDQHNTLTPCYASVYNHFASEENKPLIRFDGEYERRYSTDGINEMIRIANERGFIVSYNHPTWSLENATDYLGYENLFAVEIYNHSCVHLGLLDDEHALDDFLRAGKKLFCTAADDNHNGKGFQAPYTDSFGGWVWINAEKLDYATIMNALQRGDFYASTGPQIFSLIQDGDVVKVQTSPCRKISLSTKSRRAQTVFAEPNNTLDSAEFTLSPTDGYFRIRVVDEQGNTAYSQAYFLNE